VSKKGPLYSIEEGASIEIAKRAFFRSIIITSYDVIIRKKLQLVIIVEYDICLDFTFTF